MKLHYLILLALLLSSKAWSNCGVYIPIDYYHHESGHRINFNFDPLLFKKGYTQVSSVEEASHILHVRGEEIHGKYFHHAEGSLEILSLAGESILSSHSKRCLTMNCSVGDYVKVFTKSYKKLEKKLPHCKIQE